MLPRLYEVTPIRDDGTRGGIYTISSQSPIGAVAWCSMMPRHNWEKTAEGLLVTARHGDGAEFGKYYVKQSCFDNLPPNYPL